MGLRWRLVAMLNAVSYIGARGKLGPSCDNPAPPLVELTRRLAKGNPMMEATVKPCEVARLV